MYASPRLEMYGWTLRGPARRLPGSPLSDSSASCATSTGVTRTGIDTGAGLAALGGLGWLRFAATGSARLRALAGSADVGFFVGGAVLRRATIVFVFSTALLATDLLA